MSRIFAFALFAALGSPSYSMAQDSIPPAALAELAAAADEDVLPAYGLSRDLFCKSTIGSAQWFFRNHGDLESARSLQADYDRWSLSLSQSRLYGGVTDAQWLSEQARLRRAQIARGEYSYLREITLCSPSFRWRAD